MTPGKDEYWIEMRGYPGKLEQVRSNIDRLTTRRRKGTSDVMDATSFAMRCKKWGTEQPFYLLVLAWVLD